MKELRIKERWDNLLNKIPIKPKRVDTQGEKILWGAGLFLFILIVLFGLFYVRISSKGNTQSDIFIDPKLKPLITEQFLDNLKPIEPVEGVELKQNLYDSYSSDGNKNLEVNLVQYSTIYNWNKNKETFSVRMVFFATWELEQETSPDKFEIESGSISLNKLEDGVFDITIFTNLEGYEVYSIQIYISSNEGNLYPHPINFETISDYSDFYTLSIQRDIIFVWDGVLAY